ncbi:hypothetical protein CVT26_007682, partial [Gymnopilus dilepis]
RRNRSLHIRHPRRQERPDVLSEPRGGVFEARQIRRRRTRLHLRPQPKPEQRQSPLQARPGESRARPAFGGATRFRGGSEDRTHQQSSAGRAVLRLHPHPERKSKESQIPPLPRPILPLPRDDPGQEAEGADSGGGRGWEAFRWVFAFARCWVCFCIFYGRRGCHWCYEERGRLKSGAEGRGRADGRRHRTTCPSSCPSSFKSSTNTNTKIGTQAESHTFTRHARSSFVPVAQVPLPSTFTCCHAFK